LRKLHPRPARYKSIRLFAASSIAALLPSLLVPSSTETAVANGDTRTLYLYHSHTGESIQATFRVNGSYDPAVLEKLNYFLRDWRNNDATRMDPRLFDVVWEVYRTAGVTTQPIVIVSAYRSPQTNAMLRRRSRGVAEHSQHILGRAMDTTMPGMPMEKIREIGMRLQRGGVGWYPSSNFVHLDVGGVRSWPRMTYDQLARLFPDGKAVHLAADGRALPRYAEARAEIAARGGVTPDVQVAGAAPFGKLFSWLFNKNEDEDEADALQRQGSTGRGRHGRTELAGLGANESQPAPGAAAPASGGAIGGDQNVKPSLRLGAGAIDSHGLADASAGTINARGGSADAGLLPPRRPAASDENGALTAGVPAPPARPNRQIVSVAADVPAPPPRPAALSRLAALAAEPRPQENNVLGQTDGAAAGANGEPALARAAGLPVLITQGPKDQESVPKQVLAFASETPAPDQRLADLARVPGDIGSKAVTPLAAPLAPPERVRARAPANAISPAFPAPPLFAQPLTGLRRAARTIPDALSNKPLTEYVSSFGAEASELDPGHFTGPAAKPLSLAQGFVRITPENEN